MLFDELTMPGGSRLGDWLMYTKTMRYLPQSRLIVSNNSLVRGASFSPPALSATPPSTLLASSITITV